MVIGWGTFMDRKIEIKNPMRIYSLEQLLNKNHKGYKINNKNELNFKNKMMNWNDINENWNLIKLNDENSLDLKEDECNLKFYNSSLAKHWILGDQLKGIYYAFGRNESNQINDFGEFTDFLNQNQKNITDIGLGPFNTCFTNQNHVINIGFNPFVLKLNLLNIYEHIKNVKCTFEFTFVVTNQDRIFKINNKTQQQELIFDLKSSNSNNSKIHNLTCGFNFLLFQTSNPKQLYSYGSNVYGQLGINSFENKLHEMNVISFNDIHEYPSFEITQVKAGTSHIMALSSQNDLYSWGCALDSHFGNIDQISNHPEILNSSNSTSTSNSNLVFNKKGINKPVKLLNSFFKDKSKTIKQIETGGDHTLILTTDHKVYSFGWDQHLALGIPPPDTDKDSIEIEIEIEQNSSGIVELSKIGEMIQEEEVKEGLIVEDIKMYGGLESCIVDVSFNQV